MLSRSSSAHLLVVGTGFADEEERLRQGLEERGLVGRVHFAGWVPNAGLESYLSAADVALFPCDDDPVVRAKCSVKLAQLLALGVPVVAEAVGSCCSYITHAQTGLLVAPGALTHMAEAVAGLLASPEERERLGRAAREQMAAQFSWSTLAVRAEQAYGLE
ncbi:MAG: glycosyltransferase [Chloroflexi bacterium]|nr:glycosyltransferase [Chloroflexota bacterium]